MRHFHELASDEAGYEPGPLSIGRVVIHENVVGMLSSLREALR
jgi:hypothetical protein